MAKRGPPTLTDPYAAAPDSDAAPSVPSPSEPSPAHAPAARSSLTAETRPSVEPAIVRRSQATHTIARVSLTSSPAVPAPARPAPAVLPQDVARVSATRISAPALDLRTSIEGAALPPRESSVGPPAETPAKLGRKQRRRRSWLAIAVSLAAVVILGAALFGSLWLLDHREVPIFPQNEIGMLPERTAQFSRFHARGAWFAANQPEEAAWSKLAHDLCGGHDVYRLLLDSKLTRAGAVRALDERRHTGKALACGKAMAAKLGRAVYFVGIPVRERSEKRSSVREAPSQVGDAATMKKTRPVRLTTRPVAVYQLALDELPETTSWFIEQRERGGLVGTRCVSDTQKDSCPRSAHASARLEKTDLWVSGALADIEHFGREFAADGANQTDHEKKFLALAEGLAAVPDVSMGTHDTFDMGFVFNLGLRGPVAGFYEAESSIALLDAVSRYEAGWAVALRERPDTQEMTLRFHVDDADDAIDLVLDLKEWKVALKDQLDKDDDTLAATDLDAELKGVERRARKAQHAVGRRALSQAEIERQGRLVTMTFWLEPDGDERSDLEDMKEEHAERASAAAEIVRGLIAGDRPDDHLLRELGGSELVDALKDPDSSLR